MGEKTGIAWTDHTFNPWWGCVKVSPACTNCYAEAFDHRLGGDHWGPGSTRKMASENVWKQPIKWNRDAQAAGRRARVFCASMADVFEDRPELVAPRDRLWKLIEATPWLDWLLLTKRPENFATMLPWTTEPWRNVWLGTTCENQEWADRRIPDLLDVPAVVRFLSVEPMLGEVSIPSYLRGTAQHAAIAAYAGLVDEPGIDWVICGSESGHGARPQNLDHVRFLRDQCAAAGVAFFLKQLTPDPTVTIGLGSWAKSGGKLIELPYLDGVQHAAFPEAKP